LSQELTRGSVPLLATVAGVGGRDVLWRVGRDQPAMLVALTVNLAVDREVRAEQEGGRMGLAFGGSSASVPKLLISVMCPDYRSQWREQWSGRALYGLISKCQNQYGGGEAQRHVWKLDGIKLGILIPLMLIANIVIATVAWYVVGAFLK
jgi:hypothetical protein